MGFLLWTLIALLNVLIVAFLITMVVVGWRFYVEFRKQPECKWVADHNNVNHRTGCNNTFYSSDDSDCKITDTLKYCPYCGKDIMLK